LLEVEAVEAGAVDVADAEVLERLIEAVPEADAETEDVTA